MTCSQCPSNISPWLPWAWTITTAPRWSKWGHSKEAEEDRSKSYQSRSLITDFQIRLKHSFIIQILKCQPTSPPWEEQLKETLCSNINTSLGKTENHIATTDVNINDLSNKYHGLLYVYAEIKETFPAWTLHLMKRNPINQTVYKHRVTSSYHLFFIHPLHLQPHLQLLLHLKLPSHHLQLGSIFLSFNKCLKKTPKRNNIGMPIFTIT